MPQISHCAYVTDIVYDTLKFRGPFMLRQVAPIYAFLTRDDHIRTEGMCPLWWLVCGYVGVGCVGWNVWGASKHGMGDGRVAATRMQ